ncbi:methylcytosine dioxygenase TET2 [Phyllopteryx taeniolatus]|uniref:methylcytosine dioxygenase TET2 n=1 Tax=Phyllopteryx taeniolatus TaxID=161469 RepID=UPI002AD31918|nr:methylcytosine dioxygenase TET2 [Phyllopteryx taeniolatus]
METDQTRHETEECLTLKKIGRSRNNSNKLHNGETFSDGEPLQITGDTNWNNYKPSTVANSMNRQNETCNDPGSVQGLLDQGSFIMNGELMNGDFKHVLAEQSFLVSQPKKFKGDSEISELKINAEFECNAQAEIKVGNRNCAIPNGDHFPLPRNKHVSINGAVLTTSTIGSTPGDLLQKTLSQYYPAQVSIAPQRSGTQDAMNDSLTSKLPGEDLIPSTFTSDFPNSAQMLETQPRQPGTSGIAENVNNFNSLNYIVNGYLNNHEIDYQQKKQQHQHLPPPCTSHERSLDHLTGMVPSSNIANSMQQHKNGPRCYNNDTSPQQTYANHNFDRNSFKERNTLQTTDAVLANYRSSPIQNMVQCGKPASGHAQQFGIQPRNFQQNFGNIHGTDCMGTKGLNPQQHIQAGLENSLDSTTQQTGNLCSTLHQDSWMEQNPSKQQTSDRSSQIDLEKRGFSAKVLSDQQRRSLQVQGQILEASTVQRFESPGMFKENIQESNSIQEQQVSLLGQPHCASAPNKNESEWQESNSNTHLMQQPPPQTKHDQKAGGHYHTPMQSEHLHDNPELQEPLSPGFFTTQQQQHCNLPRPLSHPPQLEEQQLKSPIYRPHSQPQPSQLNQQHRNNSAQPNSHLCYKNTTDIQIQRQRSFSPNSASSDSRQFQLQQPNNCQPSNNTNFPQTSTQSQPYLPQSAINQQIAMHMYPKTEHQLNACSQLQRGSHLGSPIPHRDFQKHEALRTHLLQRQERQGPPHSTQSTRDSNHGLTNIKIENGPRFNLPGCSQQQPGGLQIKQENQQSVCENIRQNNILASMEQSLKQYQLSPVFEKKSFVINSNKVKVESSGPVTILSTNTDMCKVEASVAATSMTALKRTPDSTPKKEQLLQRFMDSPMKLFDTPIKSLLDTPIKTQYEIASCHCVEQISEKDEGPYYTHLGSAPTVAGIREEMERRSGLNGQAIRMEKVVYTGKEGKSTQGCPIAKWVIRRASVEEKLLVLVRERTGHKCETACIIVAILVWEGIHPSLADKLYLELSETLTKHGALTQRRCALNEERTCACQGLNPDACGASFSFGCSWSMYYNGCKFARSKIPRKFKLQGDDVREEERLEQNFQHLATLLGPLYKNMAPEAYGNQVEHEHRAPDCRLGVKEGRPFSGVTACLDFCAHAHRDVHNMQGGSTVVCTLTREDNREVGKIPADEQLHVLPLYKVANTDEYGSEEGQQEKIKTGAIQALSAFRRQVRMLAEPAKSCRQKKLDAKKAAAVKNAMLDNSHDKAEKVTPSKIKAGTCESITLSTPVPGFIPGAMGASQHPNQPTDPLGVHSRQLQHQQHENILTSYPGATNVAKYPRFPGHPGSFPSTSKPGSMFPHQSSTPASPYPSPVHAPNSLIDGAKRSYHSYQCNGGMPLDNYHPYYASNQKQLDMYQRQVFHSEQQYAAHQRFEVNYPPNYGDPGLQVNGYNTCSKRPVQPLRAFSPCIPNGAGDPRFMDPLSRAPSAHRVQDYTAAGSNCNQFGRAPHPYLGSLQMLPPGQQPFHMQIKQEMGIANPKMLGAQLSDGCLNPEIHTGLDMLNCSPTVNGIKQEPGAPQRPTTPQKPEIWSDNEHNFLDPDIGGVAVAPSHGSVLIECAKRELHATTPLKNPDRHHPTRISLVFYQHKNLNEAKHGLAMWEAKMAEKAREKEEDAERNGGEGTPSKGNKKGTKREHPEPSESLGEPPYKRFIKALIEGSLSCTTNTYVNTSPYAFTKVTGPYSHFA